MSDIRFLLGRPQRKCRQFNVIFDAYIEDSVLKLDVFTRWTRTGANKVPEGIFSIMTGLFNGQVLNSIEQHGTDESKEIIEKIQKLLDEVKNILSKHEESLSPITSSFDYEDEEGFI